MILGMLRDVANMLYQQKPTPRRPVGGPKRGNRGGKLAFLHHLACSSCTFVSHRRQCAVDIELSVGVELSVSAEGRERDQRTQGQSQFGRLADLVRQRSGN